MIESLKITVLVENSTSNPALKTEHGFSLLVETNKGSLLFDTGKSGIFIENARFLQCNLNRLNTLILSHGHYDHGGGIDAFLQNHPYCTIHACPGIFDRRWAIHKGKKPRYIGLDEKVKEAENLFFFHDKPFEVIPSCYFLGKIPREFPLAMGVDGFYSDAEGNEKDYVPDDSGILLVTNKGGILVTGCGHSGIANYIKYVMDRFPMVKLNTIIGGLHLKNSSAERFHLNMEWMLKAGVRNLALSHCTGEDAIRKFEKIKELNVVRFVTGSVFDLNEIEL